MTASKRFAKVVAKCRANFEKNSELVARKTKRRMWDPKIPGMNNPIKSNGKRANYFTYLIRSTNIPGIHCSEVNSDNAQKLRWCGLVETKKHNDIEYYHASSLGKDYILAVIDCVEAGVFI